MTASEFYTNRYYTWEKRGKGWGLADDPIELESPFIPFFHHGFQPAYIDDGKRHTLISGFLNFFSSRKTPTYDEPVLDYDTIEPFIYEGDHIHEALQLHFPNDRKITPERMKAVIVMLSMSEANISFEIIGTHKNIILQFVGSKADMNMLETIVASYFPECLIKRDSTFLDNIINRELLFTSMDFGLEQELYRPVFIPSNYHIDPLTGIFGVLEQLPWNSQAGVQILFKGTRNDWNNSIRSAVVTYDDSSFFVNDSLAPKLSLEKTQSPLFAVTMRVFSQSRNEQVLFDTTRMLAQAVWNSTKGSWNAIAPLISETYTYELRAVDILYRQSHRMGMLLNADELCTMLHFPSESIVSKKLISNTRKTAETPAIALNKHFVLGENLHNGVHSKVTIGLEERYKHTHIIGATGTGKSTLIANLIRQDIDMGNGVVLFDPHGDLVDDVITLIPPHRRNDVVLIDPSDKEYSIGFNILQANSEIEKEVLSSDLVASFRKHATSWGDQMNSVLGNAILAILEHKQGGSLQDLRRFLIESSFRTQWLSGIDNPYITSYWLHEYPLLKTSSIGSILTRLDTFMRSRNIRDMVSQQQGLDFEHLLNTNKIILLKLSQGLIGKENSFLLGSLFLSKIHQAILQRQQSTKRMPVSIYLDEFQNFITPSIQEMLSGIRKYQVGLTISHQDLQQLQREDSELLNSVLGNVCTRIVFRVGEPDAKKLQDGFSHFTFTDFQNLGRGEAIVKIEQPQYDCSLTTIPLSNTTDEERQEALNVVRTHSQKTYGVRRDSLEPVRHEQFTKSNQEIPPVEKAVQFEKVETPSPSAHESLPQQEVVKNSVHRYLQTLVKKMAEQRGYIAGIETLLPDGSGQVDVLLTKDTMTFAVEICNTTDADWEMHNIIKCLNAKYNLVISLSGDTKQLERIRKKCEADIPDFSSYPVRFYTPDALFVFLDETIQASHPPKENIVKGYRVNVSYNSMEESDLERKRKSVANVVLNSIKKQRKKG